MTAKRKKKTARRVACGFCDALTVSAVEEMDSTLMLAAKRAVEAQLPEDEPDHTPDWVYRTVIAVGLRAGIELGRPMRAV